MDLDINWKIGNKNGLKYYGRSQQWWKSDICLYIATDKFQRAQFITLQDKTFNQDLNSAISHNMTNFLDITSSYD